MEMYKASNNNNNNDTNDYNNQSKSHGGNYQEISPMSESYSSSTYSNNNNSQCIDEERWRRDPFAISEDERTNKIVPSFSIEENETPFLMFMSSEDDELPSTPEPSMPPPPLPCASSTTANNATTEPVTIKKRRKKKKLVESLSSTRFKDVYYLTGDVLGEGSYGRVETCINMYTDVEFAVKIISKKNWCFSRSKVLKEVELYYFCQGQKEIIQLIEYFEEDDYFYLIFEKAYGGPLLNQIQKRVHFSEEEAVSIIRDLAMALRFLHKKGIAHRDLKPENILCVNSNAPYPIKLCDFDLCSSVSQTLSTPLLQSPVGSAEYMAPEVVNAFDYDDFSDEDEELTYDKKCDIWSLGIIAYILLCGYLPFSGHCDKECGWDKGEECLQCQQSLFESIRSGSLVFPDQHWSSISSEAKDLITKLLVKDASQRLDTDSILCHPWIKQGGSSDKSLETPSVLRRQTSVKEISEFTTNVLAIKRNFETNLSFSRAFDKLLIPDNTTGGDPTIPNSTKNLVTPMRKSSAQVFRESGGQLRHMRRQTSMVLLEHATRKKADRPRLIANNSLFRCEH